MLGDFVKVWFCFAFGLLGNAELEIKPQNATSVEGERVQFNCSTDVRNRSRPIQWQYILPNARFPSDIFVRVLNKTIQESYKIDVNESTGTYNLIISSVLLNQSGTIYRCTELVNGNRLSHSEAFLTVREKTVRLTPPYYEVKIGAAVWFNCTTKYKDSRIIWEHAAVGEEGKVVNGNGFTQAVHEYNETKIYELHVRDVKLQDGGDFRCIDNDTKSNESAQLTVVGSPQCMPSVTDLNREMMNLTCIVQFSGHRTPLLQWIDSAGVVIVTNVTVINYSDRVESVLMTGVKAESISRCVVVSSNDSCSNYPSSTVATDSIGSSQSTNQTSSGASTGLTTPAIIAIIIVSIICIVFFLIMVVCYVKRRRSQNGNSSNGHRPPERVEMLDKQ